MIWIHVSFVLFAIFYAVFFEKRRKAWLMMRSKQRDAETIADLKHLVPLSVVIPFRNEAPKLPRLLNTLLEQSHTDCEFLFVDDQSKDRGRDIIHNCNDQRVRLLTSPEIEGKKSALKYGIEAASHQHIVCTDADVYAGKHWLALMAQGFQNEDIRFVSGPVQFNAPDHFWGGWLRMEFAALIATGASSIWFNKPNMCNGANLGFRKEAWKEAFPGQKGKELPTGDDLFLMHRIAELHPDGLLFIPHPDAKVFTDAPDTLQSFLSQRIRWASKSSAYRGMRLKLEPLMIWLLCMLILFLPVAGFFDYKYFYLAILLFFVKTVVDYRFFNAVLPFFDQKILKRHFLFSEILHVLYVSVTGILASFGAYSWKGRNAKHK